MTKTIINVSSSLPAPTLTVDDGSVHSSPSAASGNDADAIQDVEPTQIELSPQEEEGYTSESNFSSSLPVRDKIMHYLKGRTVCHRNREAVKNVIVAAGGLKTMEYEKGITEQCNKIIVECYKAIVQGFCTQDFKVTDLRLKNIMMDRLKHTQGPMTGEKFWNKFNATRKEICLCTPRSKHHYVIFPLGSN